MLVILAQLLCVLSPRSRHNLFNCSHQYHFWNQLFLRLATLAPCSRNSLALNLIVILTTWSRCFNARTLVRQHVMKFDWQRQMMARGVSFCLHNRWPLLLNHLVTSSHVRTDHWHLCSWLSWVSHHWYRLHWCWRKWSESMIKIATCESKMNRFPWGEQN